MSSFKCVTVHFKFMSQPKFTSPGFPLIERPLQGYNTWRTAELRLLWEGTRHCRTAPWKRKALAWWGGQKHVRMFKILGRWKTNMSLLKMTSMTISFHSRAKNLRQRFAGRDEEQGQLGLVSTDMAPSCCPRHKNTKIKINKYWLHTK